MSKVELLTAAWTGERSNPPFRTRFQSSVYLFRYIDPKPRAGIFGPPSPLPSSVDVETIDGSIAVRVYWGKDNPRFDVLRRPPHTTVRCVLVTGSDLDIVYAMENPDYDKAGVYWRHFALHVIEQIEVLSITNLPEHTVWETQMNTDDRVRVLSMRSFGNRALCQSLSGVLAWTEMQELPPERVEIRVGLDNGNEVYIEMRWRTLIDELGLDKPNDRDEVTPEEYRRYQIVREDGEAQRSVWWLQWHVHVGEMPLARLDNMLQPLLLQTFYLSFSLSSVDPKKMYESWPAPQCGFDVEK